MNRFSHIFELDRNKMAVDPNLFQGRQSEYSQDTVNAIVSKGTYDKSGAPIIVWHDAVLDKYLVISGHSRFEATSQLYLAGDKSLQTIPVKEFLGDKDAAIDYAVLESNRSGTEEGLKSDILAFRRAVQTGKNKDYLKSVSKPESKLHKLQKLYFLNPEGEFIHWLTKESSQSFPFLERNAIWVGELRSQLPSLSDSHEKEIFDWLYNSGSKKQLELKKADFYKKIDNRVNRIDFDPTQPLNLENHVSANVYADPLNEEIKAIDAEIEKLKKETDRNRENIVRARAEKKDEFIPKFQTRIKEIDTLIIRKIQEREDLRVKIGKLERNIVADLFSMDDNPAPVASLTPVTPVTPVTKEGFTEAKDLNKIYADLKSKYGDKKGRQLYEAVNMLVNPNKNTIVEIRSNGVVVKEGDKYIFKAFTNTDFNIKKWSLNKGWDMDISEQFQQSPSPRIRIAKAKAQALILLQEQLKIAA